MKNLAFSIFLILSLIGMSVNAFSMFEESSDQTAENTKRASGERARTEGGDNSLTQVGGVELSCSDEKNSYTTGTSMDVHILAPGCSEFAQDSTTRLQAPPKAPARFEGTKMEVVESSPSSVKRTMTPEEQEEAPSAKRTKTVEDITMNVVQESKPLVSDFPVRSERNKILQQAVDVAKELVDYNKNVNGAVHPFFLTFNNFNDPSRNELDKKLSLAYGEADLRAISIAEALKEIESRLAQKQEDAAEVDLRQASHEDALLLKQLQVAAETLHPATQDVIAQGTQLLEHPFYGTKVDPNVRAKLQEVATTSLFDQIDSISHSLKMREVGDFFPTVEDKKVELRDSIEYMNAVSDYARGLIQGDIPTLLSYTIDNCGEGIELEEDICQINAQYQELEAALTMSNMAMVKVQNYLAELEAGTSSISIQEESHVFAAIRVTAPLLREKVDTFSATLKRLDKEYQSDWRVEKREEFLEKFQAIEAPYQAFMEAW